MGLDSLARFASLGRCALASHSAWPMAIEIA